MSFIPFDGLGMDHAAMLELVKRMNENDDRKWVLRENQPPAFMGFFTIIYPA